MDAPTGTILKPRDINNKVALRKSLAMFKLNFDWIERLDLVTNSEHELSDKDVDNDFIREQHFAKQAYSAIMEAIPRLKSYGIKVRRPDDYIAEMAKSESHMRKIKEAQAEQEAVMAKIEKAKRLRKERKMAKMVNTQVKLSKQKEKKEFNKKISNFKKGIDKNLDFLEETSKKETKKSDKTPKKKITKKAEYKLKKFGFGGQKKRKKYNTADSSADVSSFNRRSSANRKAGKKYSNKKGKKMLNRPGKERRKQMKMRSNRKK